MEEECGDGELLENDANDGDGVFSHPFIHRSHNPAMACMECHHVDPMADHRRLSHGMVRT